MAELGTGRFNRLLQRLLVIKADPPAPELAPEVVAVLPLDDVGLEWEYLKGGRLMAGAWSQAALAANNSGARLRNPAGSGILIIVVAVRYTVTVAGEVIVTRGVSTSNLASAVTEISRDARAPDAGAGIVSNANTVTAAGDLVHVEQLGANTPAALAQVAVLSPSSSLDVVTNHLNTNLSGSFWWVERAQEASEV